MNTHEDSEVVLHDFVPGGQVLGEFPDGKKVFVWGGLPGEKVRLEIIKSKKKWAEAVVTKVVIPSDVRVAPKDPDSFLATSPWQIIDFAAENEAKKRLLHETFSQAHINLPDFQFIAGAKDYHYRNKMEYSFWADDSGLHLALYNRGTHQKRIVTGSSIAMPGIDEAARDILEEMNRLKIEGRQLKTIILRCDQGSAVVASLFVKTASFPRVKLPPTLNGMKVYFSNPKSPASVPTKLLYELGEGILHDTILKTKFSYNADSFFQVNIEPYISAIRAVQPHVADGKRIVDMYAGVGSIGVTLGASQLIELDPATAAMARKNAPEGVDVIEASSEKSLEYITKDATIIFDPPRAGLHARVIERILEVRPPKIVYLSCNPATQARDIAQLQGEYELAFFEGYNFFPHTPHIESLAVLELK